jgi:hypothetical protein
MKLYVKLFIVLFAAAWTLSACAPTVEFSPEMNTSVANTVVAMQTQTASAITPSPLPPTATIDPLATFTAIPTFAPTIAPTGTQLPGLWISAWKDITIPAGTKVKAREAFTKKWTLTNGGSIAWQKDYLIVFVSGDNMGVSTMPLGVVVEPGSSVEITLNLVAPSSLGTHTSNFMLQTPNGQKFGYGDNADRPFSVNIVIEDYFAVTGAKAVVSVPSGATCPVEITLKAEITANTSGQVTYRFVTSQGDTETYSMDFSAAGTNTSKGVKFTVNDPADLTVAIYVDNPNHQSFPAITVTAPCTP